jgi:predicted phosphodiesterase
MDIVKMEIELIKDFQLFSLGGIRITLCKGRYEYDELKMKLDYMYKISGLDIIIGKWTIENMIKENPDYLKPIYDIEE